MSEIIINKHEDEIMVCMLENNKICERYVGSRDKASILGNIYIGRIEKIVDGMQAAFVNIGLEKNAFISIKDVLPKIDIVKESIKQQEVKMSAILKVGDYIMVQVKKEPSIEKGARISTHITFPGNYIVLMPDTSIITVSQKIEEKSEIDRLKDMLKRNLPNGYGAIVRTNGKNVPEGEIRKDIENVIKKWNKVRKSADKKHVVELIYDDYDMIEKTMRDMIGQGTEKIYVNDMEIKRVLEDKFNAKLKVEYKGVESIINELGLLTEYERIDNRKVWLNCGGYIAIDKTEALTAVDVNSGKYTGNIGLESTIVKVNCEAAEEIMKQIRLKDIGGIIIVDFIDMKRDESKARILEIMKKEAKKDRSKVDIRNFTELNLVEMTRKKMFI